jgi:hypothetical protein
MFINAKIVKIFSDGYERCIRISTSNNLIEHLWCYLVDTEVYVDSSTDNGTINVGQEVTLKLSIEWVNSYNILDSSENKSYNQTIKESSHIEAIALILSVVDEYTLICDIGYLKGIAVEFESKHKNISNGDIIKFTGNLKAELT